jgi:hypothetical protein
MYDSAREFNGEDAHLVVLIVALRMAAQNPAFGLGFADNLETILQSDSEQYIPSVDLAKELAAMSEEMLKDAE